MGKLCRALCSLLVVKTGLSRNGTLQLWERERQQPHLLTSPVDYQDTWKHSQHRPIPAWSRNQPCLFLVSCFMMSSQKQVSRASCISTLCKISMKTTKMAFRNVGHSLATPVICQHISHSLGNWLYKLSYRHLVQEISWKKKKTVPSSFMLTSGSNNKVWDYFIDLLTCWCNSCRWWTVHNH